MSNVLIRLFVEKKVLNQLFLSLAIFIATLLLFLNAKAQCSLTPPAKVPLGANLNEVADYIRDRPFNDVFKSSRIMSGNITQPFNFTSVLLDNKGWPLQDFGVVVMTEMTSDMGGTYTIQFKGQATIQPVSGSNFTVANKIYKSSTNTTTAELVYPAIIPDGTSMFIGFTNTRFNATSNGIKDIKIMKPGLTVSAPTFSSQFLTHLLRFDCIRYMDWRKTNGNNDSLWGKRTLKTLPSQQQENGIAWEYVIELANTLQKDIWINIPHKVNNTYITNLATLLRDSLSPNLNIYVEYSNELWNSQFAQTQFINEKSLIEGNTPGSVINFDNVNDQFTWRMRYVAKRSKTISDLFKNVFGATAINNRVRVVLPQQFGFFDFTVRGVEFVNKFYGLPSRFFYALAIAPYFATNALDAVNASASTTQILNELELQMNNIYPPFRNQMDAWAARAAFFGLKMVAYEGGPDTFGPNNVNSKTNANRNARMRFICNKYLTNWYRYGFVSLFNWYLAGAANYNGPFGTWALTENFENSQKLRALDSVHNAAVPAFSAGQVSTATIDPRMFAGFDSLQLGNPFFKPGIGFNEFFEYLIRVPAGQDGIYTLNVGTCANATGQSYRIQVDNNSGTVITPVNNNFASFLNVQITNISLKEGFHAIRLTVVGGSNFRINQFTLTRTGNCTGLSKQPLSVNFEPEISDFSIFPNPASNVVLLNTRKKYAITQINMVNAAGINVKTWASKSGLQQLISLPVNDQENGMYILLVKFANGTTEMKKVIIQH